MPYALIIAGIVLTVAGVRNTETALYTLLKGDFTGSNSFIWWTLSILGIGALGYVPETRKLANAFLALVLIVLVLANKGVFQQFSTALKGSIPTAPVGNTAPAAATASSTPQLSLGSALSSTTGFLQSLGTKLATGT